MAQVGRALTELVKAHVGPGKRWTLRAFVERAVDPGTGYTPSKSLIGNIIGDLDFKVTPQLISALAVGMDIERKVVAEAAHIQFIGYDVSDLAQEGHERSVTVRVAHEPGINPADLPKSRDWLATQEGEG